MILLLLLVTLAFQAWIPHQAARADVVAGFSEYIIPGPQEQLYSIMTDLTTATSTTSNVMSVITIPITALNLTVYYDHWENGYSTGASGDETFSGYSVGSVLTFTSPTIPSNPRGTSLTACTGSSNPAGSTSNCYDGMDRIFVVGGAVSISQVFWPSSDGTVFANAWEIYPVKVYTNNYVMPVGENLYTTNSTSYGDFDCVYVLMQAIEDDTTVTFDNTRSTAPASGTCGVNAYQDQTVTLDQGKSTWRGGVYSGSTITSDKPVQVQYLVGREDSNFDSRTHTLVPTALWTKEYYSPVPSYGTTTTTKTQTNGTQPSNARLRKTVAETSFSSVGTVLHYNYAVTRSSTGATLTGPVTVADNKTTVTCPAVTSVGDGDNTLETGETLNCTATYTVTAADLAAGSVANTATATIVGSNPDVLTNSSTVTIFAPQIATPVNIYMYNPTASVLPITFQDSTGTVVCNVPALGTLSIRDSACAGRFSALGSAAHLTAAENFFAIGEYDSGSATRNWGFSLIPNTYLTADYYIAWAPGTTDLTQNGSPVFITPTVNGQVFYVDYSPLDGTVEQTYTLNLLQVQKIRDPDNDNTGMRVWSDSPFAITWGEDAEFSSTGNPYIDAGYTILPLDPSWVQIGLDVDKTANPEVIMMQAGQTVEFTIVTNTNSAPIDNIFIEDYLPPYFDYVPGTTSITWPGGSSTAEPVKTGAAATGYTLHWGTAPDNIADLAVNQTMTLRFSAITVTGFNAPTSVNNTSVTGYWGTIPLTASAAATVTSGLPGYITIVKDANANGPTVFPFSMVDTVRPQDPTAFSLLDNGSGVGNSITYGLRAGTYTVTETPIPNGWQLLSIICVDPTSNTSVNLAAATATINLVAGETVTCTFTNIDHPTAVTMVNQIAEAGDDQVFLRWETAMELDLFGFNILRSDRVDGERVQLNAVLIPAKGTGGLTGAAYEFVDSNVQRGKTYYYWIQLDEMNGLNDAGSAMTVSVNWILRLPIIIR